MNHSYPFSEFEPRWQGHWISSRAFHARNPEEVDFDPKKKKRYILDMFPYPSGDGLHVGHLVGYTATDILSRYYRMRGENVLHPMGWDAFGLPAEQYAIKTGQHPRVTTEQNINNFRRQLQTLGFSYDWEREVNTTDPDYFRWTQWIFLQLYHAWVNPASNKVEPISTYHGDDVDAVRLAYISEMPVNWCPALGTVLANEEVVDGKSDVGGFPVERRPMRQWMFRITALADRLIEDLEKVAWPESIKQLQRNWIGRSEGAEVIFTIKENPSQKITVFTTRVDTLYGTTYLVLAPEHPLLDQLQLSPAIKENLKTYREGCSTKKDLERTDLAKTKTGIPLGVEAINPINGETLPIWVADYVLMHYGTGAVMAVPAHDERDYEFAQQFQLPLRVVIEADSELALPFSLTEGKAINSPLVNGLAAAEAKAIIIKWLEAHGWGRGVMQYKLRDWLFSRQRYWGEPFPIVWEEGKHRALSLEELPVRPPEMEDFRPTGTAEPPLAKAKEWVRYSENATRELNTMPQWAGSCWYYLRFCDPHNRQHFIGKEAEAYWQNVDLYVGGTEHAVLHLLYARFWHKALFDLGCLTTVEPFQRLVNQGMILGSDGQKMSKSRGNVVNPSEVIKQYGADAVRLFEMFMGPLEHSKPWSTTGVEGIYRFLARIWRLAMKEQGPGEWSLSENVTETPLTSAQQKTVHATIKKVTKDIEALSFNTAIAQMMIFVNEFTSAKLCPLEALQILLQLLSPFAPHLAEELWSSLAEKFPSLKTVAVLASQAPWPIWQEEYLCFEEVTYAVQVNGKVRTRLTLPSTASKEAVEKAALAEPALLSHLENKKIEKVIIVPGRLVNIVAS
ncbi:MAG: leucine--tRNA ligase [Chthoniobacterales bacterium]|nr:leucine--tRNA ligase [Chthoniobacterales bacterium]